MQEDVSAPAPYRQIRARHTDRTITVYQAYSSDIAERALAAGTFVPSFSRGRATWIKPSFPVDGVPQRLGREARPGTCPGHWIVAIRDVTPLMIQVRDLTATGRLGEARRQLPAEHPYPVDPQLAGVIGIAG
jgi:hypothetical protein